MRHAQLHDDSNHWLTWREQSALPEVDHALRELYAELDAAVAARGPTCWSSGKCCDFDRFGHRLYVTGLEIAWFLQNVPLETTPPVFSSAPADQTAEVTTTNLHLPQFAERPGACPYQISKLCSTHTIRPLGCRVFFCQQGTEVWQQELYEDFLRRLQRLHDEHEIEYRYLDWIAGLEAATPHHI